MWRLWGPRVQPSLGSGHLNPPRVVGEAGGRLTGGYCSSDDPKWREMEQGKAQIDWQARGLKKDLRGSREKKADLLDTSVPRAPGFPPSSDKLFKKFMRFLFHCLFIWVPRINS